MKNIIEAIIWVTMNLVGGWLVATNLFQVGRLGAAAVGILILAAAWVWLLWVLVSFIRRGVENKAQGLEQHK
jgi:hypothetical protein